MVKRIIGIVGLAAVLLVAGGVVLFYYSGQKGEGSVEKWIGQQLQLIANSYLNPRLSFESLDYQAPGTVRVTNLRLTAEDPAHPGATIDIVAARDATITLAEIPRFGEPILIERVALTQPALRAVFHNGSMIGFDNLLRVSVTRPSDLPAGTPKPSDVFKIRQIEIKNGKFVYDPRREGSAAMELDQINSAIEVKVGSAGQYQIEATFGRKPVLDASASARLDIDTLRLTNGRLAVNTSIDGPDSLTSLPPALQGLLKQYNARGSLELLITGDVPLRDLSRTRLQTDLKLAQAAATFGEYQLPLDAISLQADLRDSRLNIRKFVVSAIQGQVLMSGSIRMNDTLDAKMELHGSGLRLEDLETTTETSQKKLRGKLAGNIFFEAPLRTVASNWPATRPATDAIPAAKTRWGNGDIQLVDSRLETIPLLSSFADAVIKATKFVNPKQGQPSDRLFARFDLIDNRVEFGEIHYVGSAVGLRGKGSIGFDQKLDLLLNGGPIERVQDMLGRFGEAWGRVTDAMVGYQVTGTLSEPKVTIRPAPTVFSALEKLGDAIVGDR